jgi:Uncharacterized protein conserved in bacteria (DUF2147)
MRTTIGFPVYRFLRLTTAALAVLLLLSPFAFAQTGSADDILGVWLAANKKLKIEMFQSGREYNAHLLGGDRVVEKDGKTYRCKAESNDSKLELRGYLGVSLLGRTLTLTRLD